MLKDQKRGQGVPRIEAVKFIERSNGTVKGYAVNTFQGLVKGYNEDRVSIIMNITKPNFKGRWPRCSYFGVFDGHGGNKCSDFLKDNMHKYITENAHFPHQPIEALKFGFKKAEQEFLALAQRQNPVERSGSCAIVVLIIDEVCYIANVGDSRAILSANQGLHTYAISKDHKPDSETERERIYRAGGRIYQTSVRQKSGNVMLGPHRIDPGKLSVSRSFGDIEAKLPKYDGNPKVLIARPEITFFEINPDEHDFIMICSDGVYDKLENEAIAHCFWEQRDKAEHRDNYQFIGRVPSRVIEKSMESHSMDNLTSLVVVFEDHGKLMLPPSRMPGIQSKESSRPYSSNTENEDNNKRRKTTRGIPLEKEEAPSFSRTAKLEEYLPHFPSHQEKQQQSPLQLPNDQTDGLSDMEHRVNNRDSKDYREQLKENREKIKDNREHQKENRDSQRERSEQQRNIVDPLQKMAKRKSSANILLSNNDKRTDLGHGTHSLNSSISAKMLAGTKAYHKRAKEGQKPNLDLLHKKKSMDYIRREKQSIWKQAMTLKNNELKEKLIRF